MLGVRRVSPEATVRVVRVSDTVTIEEVLACIATRRHRDAEWPRIKDTAQRWDFIRQIYREETPSIIEAAQHNGRCCPYFVDWDFTPIEEYAWMDIRGLGLPLYPQVPVSRYFIDFADPHLKIGVELDGKRFHEAARDRRRDEDLWSLGWRIFRIPGFKSLPAPAKPFDGDWQARLRDERNEFLYDVRHWATRWSEGIFWAIKYFFYTRESRRDPLFRDAAIGALSNNRYVEFPLDPEDE